MPSIIAPAAGTVVSADFTISGSTTYQLTTASGSLPNGGYAEVQYKNTAGGYTTFITLDQGRPLHVSSAAGTFRVVKYGDSFGVDYTQASSGGGGGGGDASAAKQDTGNTSLASIDTKTPALQGGSVPVTATTQALPAGTNRSGTVTTGGTAQQLAPANTSRKNLTGQNISTADLWINEIGGTAAANTAGSYRVPAGSGFAIATNQVISVFGATTGQAWTATET